MKVRLRSFVPAIGWLIASTIAFCLPGEALPQRNWFDVIHIDKWVHVIIFTGMILLWSLPYFYRTASAHLNNVLLSVFGIFFGYGVVIEVVQHFFIAHRSFDLTDIAADAVGCCIGFLFVKKYQRNFAR